MRSGSRRWRFVTALSMSAVMCGGFVAVPGRAVAFSGLQRFAAATATDSTDSKQVFAQCPAGAQVVGGGASIVNGLGQVLLTGYRMVEGVSVDYVWAAAREDQDLYSGAWALHAYAICGPSIFGLTIVSATADNGSPQNQLASAWCPVGKRVYGMGGWIDGGGRQVLLHDVYAMGGLVGVGAWATDPGDDYDDDWTVTAYAACGRPVAGLQEVYGQSADDSSSPKTLTLSCPPGTAVHGIGGRLQGASHDATLDDLVPNAALDTVIVKAYEDQDGDPDSWWLNGSVICAP